MSIKRIVENDKNTLNMVKAKKAQNDADILAYMDAKHASIKRFLTYVLDERLNPDKNREELDRISLPQITTMYGIVVDKSVKAKELAPKAVDANADRERDPLTKSIYEAVDHGLFE